jgi:CubicO group peptidase (beta-lactamase class C family)
VKIFRTCSVILSAALTAGCGGAHTEEHRQVADSGVLDGFVPALDERVPRYLEESRVPGAAVALIQNGDVVYQRGFGYADLERRVPVTPQTGFNVGSISKTVAAWGVMRLVEENRIGLDTPVEQYLTRWRLPASEFDASGVTVRRLLSHTAGLSLSGYPGWAPDDELPSIEESLSGVTNGPGDVRLIMEPGTRFSYSGGGYTLLQLLVEEVTGRSFSDYMRAAVFEPLGMRRSSFELTPEILAGSSPAHNEFGEPTWSPRFTAQAAAGLHTTVEDLAAFAAAALANGTRDEPGRGVISPATVALMMSPAPAADSLPSPAGLLQYGLGYSMRPFRDGMVAVGHGGANHGWHALFEIVRETGDGLVVVTNGSNGWSAHEQVYCDWMEWQTGTRPMDCRKSVAIALINVIAEHGVEAAITHYAALKRDRPDEYRFDEWELLRLGYGLLQGDRLQDAVAILTLNLEEYPESATSYEILGEAYIAAEEKDLAIASFERALELDPGSANAARKLEELRGR